MGLLDTASSILGGASGSGAAAGDVPLTYYRGEDLAASASGEGGAQAPEDLRTHDGGAAIEFIHFGYVHPDSSSSFQHGKKADDKLDRTITGGDARAFVYRAALEREALLGSSFMAACQCAMKEYEDSKGGLGEAIAMASDLIGGGGGSSGPKAADLNQYGEKVKTACAPVNVDPGTPLGYKAVHQAGIDLHQAYENYAAYRDNLIDHPPGSGGGPGLLDQVGAVAGALPGMGSIVQVIQGIAFKMFDVYLGIYSRIAKEQEPRICEAARRMSVDAIRKGFSPVFPVWYPPPEAPAAASGGGGSGSGTGVGVVDDASKSAEDAASKAQQGYQDVKDFFEGGGKPAPGAQYLEIAFGTAPPATPAADEAAPPPQPPKAIADLVITAFKSTLDMSSLPTFVEDMAREILMMNADFLRAVYRRLCEMDPGQPIDEEALNASARKRMLQRMVDLVISEIGFLQQAKDFGPTLQGVQLSPGRALDAGEGALAGELSRALDPVLGVMIGSCVDKLEGARQQAAKEKAMTMEVYLGLFPYLIALNFRNTFFPVWDLLMQNTFGRVGGPLGDVVHSASSAMKDAKSKVDDARDVKQRADKVAEDATDPNQGLSLGTGGTNLDTYEKDMKATADRGPDRQRPEVIPFFPLSARSNEAVGQAIVKSEYDEVSAKDQWAGAIEPPVTGALQ